MSWARVQEHEALAEAFRQVIRRGRLGHAYLFVGPKGVGKRQFAIELAKAILCEAPGAEDRLEACAQCPACLQIEAGAHPDCRVVEMPEDKHEFPIDLMQALIQNLALKPARGRRRIAIVDDADYLNEESANCFLKTLEEPPASSLLVLLATSADRQLPTIRSRCQLIRFKPLSADLLAQRLLESGAVKAPEAAQRLSRLSKGSLEAAAALAEPGVLDLRTDLLAGLTKQPFDSVSLSQRLVAFADQDVKDSAEKRRRAALAIGWIIEAFREALALRAGRTADSSASPDSAVLTRLAERLSPDQLIAAAERSVEAMRHVERRVQLVLALEGLMDALHGIISVPGPRRD